MSSMAERLQVFRNAVGLTQREVATMCNIGKRTLIYWEMGEREIRCSKLIPLMREYDLNFNWLIADEGEMYLEPTSYSSQAGMTNPDLDHAYEIDNHADQESGNRETREPAKDASEEEDESGGTPTDADVLPLIRRLRHSE